MSTPLRCGTVCAATMALLLALMITPPPADAAVASSRLPNGSPSVVGTPGAGIGGPTPPPASTPTWDVVVHAATPGGVMAAVAAGREGRRTVLLEPGPYIGGAMAGGLGQADYGVHATVIGGLSREFFARVAEAYGVPFAYVAPQPCAPCAPPPHGCRRRFFTFACRCGSGCKRCAYASPPCKPHALL